MTPGQLKINVLISLFVSTAIDYPWVISAKVFPHCSFPSCLFLVLWSLSPAIMNLEYFDLKSTN